jgi:hypothetical protein
LTLSPTTARAFARLAADLQKTLGDRFVALVAYGSHQSMAFAESILTGDLQALGTLAESWHHDGLAAPLLLTPAEFRRSLDVFPLEYQAILDRHVVIAGRPPFDVAVESGDLRRGCEAQARSHLIHLRQGWLQAGAHDAHLAEMIERSALPFQTLVAHVAQLEDGGRPATASASELAAFAERAIGMRADLAQAIFDLEAHPERSRDLVPRLPEYLAAAERLWHLVDTWRTP